MNENLHLYITHLNFKGSTEIKKVLTLSCHKKKIIGMRMTVNRYFIWQYCRTSNVFELC